MTGITGGSDQIQAAIAATLGGIDLGSGDENVDLTLCTGGSVHRSAGTPAGGYVVCGYVSAVRGGTSGFGAYQKRDCIHGHYDRRIFRIVCTGNGDSAAGKNPFADCELDARHAGFLQNGL